MTKNISIGILIFDIAKFVKISPHLVRGFFGRMYPNEKLIHNHNESGVSYRLPRIQFKLIDGKINVISIGQEAHNILKQKLMLHEKICIHNKQYKINNVTLSIDEYDVQTTDHMIAYQSINPWIALKSSNYKKYTMMENEEDKKEFLESILIGNILSLMTGLEYEVHDRIHVNIKDLEEKYVNLKGKRFLAFDVVFETNIVIPDYLGIGKSSSRGYGTIKKIDM
jgi:hypothetical protein